MARQGFIPRVMGKVHGWRRTPHVSILTLMTILLVLVFLFDIRSLAEATSSLLLYVFIVVNASLVVLKNRPHEPPGAFEVPLFVPIGGIIVCSALLMQAPAASMKLAFLLLAGITLLFLIARPRNISEETIAAVAAEE
jgi:basic amino acid/polyamine antiporter, APA family